MHIHIRYREDDTARVCVCVWYLCYVRVSQLVISSRDVNAPLFSSLSLFRRRSAQFLLWLLPLSAASLPLLRPKAAAIQEALAV